MGGRKESKRKAMKHSSCFSLFFFSSVVSFFSSRGVFPSIGFSRWWSVFCILEGERESVNNNNFRIAGVSFSTVLIFFASLFFSQWGQEGDFIQKDVCYSKVSHLFVEMKALMIIYFTPPTQK